MPLVNTDHYPGTYPLRFVERSILALEEIDKVLPVPGRLFKGFTGLLDGLVRFLCKELSLDFKLPLRSFQPQYWHVGPRTLCCIGSLSGLLSWRGAVFWPGRGWFSLALFILPLVLTPQDSIDVLFSKYTPEVF